MIIWCGLSMFGLLVAHRTTSSCESLSLFSRRWHLNLRVLGFLTVVGTNILLRNNLAALGGFLIVMFLSPWWFANVIQRRREALLKEQFVPILDSLILSMKSGKGFRQSLSPCFEKCPVTAQVTMKEFISSLQYRKEMTQVTSDPQILLFFGELSEIDRALHKPLERLRALRRRISIEKNFRQKSRQALLQIRFQSWIISTMFLGLVVFVHYQFGLKNHAKLVFLTAGIFILGQVWIQKSGRNYKWKL